MATKIGEGTYGCVHKPSLKCKNKKVNYTDKVSKIMTKKHSRTEMKEYDNIANVDKSKKFYLGKPVLCVPEDDDSAKRAVNMCEHFRGNTIKDYNLLIMNDGGNNLEQYADKMARLPRTPENIEKIEKFWIEAQRILLGLKVFNDNGIVHHDLKPQNIVYNEDTNRTNFIDFGLMTDMNTIRTKSNLSQYKLGIPHWSFPLEMEFINKNSYLQLANLSNDQKSNCLNFLSLINSNIKTFFSYIVNHDKDELWYIMRLDNCDFIMDARQDNYDEFLDRVIRTIDVYGTGIAFMYILNKTRHLIEPKLENELRELFYIMITPNVFIRFLPDQVLNIFEKILLENGILSKYNKHFENHVLINNANVNIAKVNEIITAANNIDIRIDNERVNRISNSTPTKINRISSIKKTLKPCPDGKERNPLTRRCVNVCKYGYIRNAEFKCVRDKMIKLTKTRKAPKPIIEQNPLVFFR